MIPHKPGQIVKFHTLLEGENSEQQYVVLEIHDDSDNPKVKIQALNTSLPFAPINIVRLHDLKVVEVETSDLLGQVVYITTSEGKKIIGKVISINDDYVNLNLDVTTTGVQTNVAVTVEDRDGNKHSGSLFVN